MITILSMEQRAGHGAEAVLGQLLHAWPDTAPQLQVVTPLGSEMAETVTAAGHALVVFPSREDTLRRNWSAAGQLDTELRGTRFIHAWTARGFEAARRLASRLGTPAGGTLHDHPMAGFHGHLRRRIMRISANGFTRLACVSEAVQTACLHAGYRCPQRVIRNGLADAQSSESRVPGPIRIGFLGMYASWKGFGVVDAWIRATGDLKAEWLLYGEIGAELAEPAAALEKACGGRVRLMGRRPVEEIFSEIDVLAHASSGFDPLPTVLIEAARAGIPCVACDLGGAREIVIEGETGYLFPPSDPGLGLKKLRELITDSTLHQRQAAAARKRFVSSFGVVRMVQEYVSFWSEGQSEHHAAK